MSKIRLKLWRSPVYPWLVGIFPILHLYAVNFGSVIDREVPITIFLLLAATTVAFVVLNFALRNVHKTALTVTIMIIGFSLSGHVHTLLFETELLVFWSLAVLISIAAATIGLHKISTRVDLKEAAVPLNLISATLILVQVVSLIARYNESNIAQLAGSFGGSDAALQTSARIHDSDQRPDVYYIIPDAYPSNGWLEQTVNFDNASFTEALRARGFDVNEHAQSNYGTTLPSLASTLNMRYFSTNPTDLHAVDYLRLSIANSDVAKYFQQLGYTYIQLLSGYLMPSSIADINRDFTPNGTVDVIIDDEDLTVTLRDAMRDSQTSTHMRRMYQKSFLSLYMETTLLKVFDDELRSWLEGNVIGPYDGGSPRRFLATVDEIDSVALMPEATFTIIHVLKPHRPVYFDEKGMVDRISNPSDEEFIANLNFVNARYLDMIDAILDGSEHEPVIIFQADHGSTKGEVRTDQWRTIHFDVFSAYYVPARYPIEIPRPHTNINTFPLVLNSVFDAGFEFQASRLFELVKSNDKPFEQVDVTERYAHGFAS